MHIRAESHMRHLLISRLRTWARAYNYYPCRYNGPIDEVTYEYEMYLNKLGNYELLQAYDYVLLLLEDIHREY